MKILITLLLSLHFCAFADEWVDFDYEHMGLTRQQFKNLKKSGISKEKFFDLIHIGITSQQYLSKPWLTLNVSEEDWISQRKLGMADDDIDQSWKKKFIYKNEMWTTLFLPGYYQYKRKNYYKSALSITLFTSGLLSWGASELLLKDPYASNFLYLALLGNIYSFADAWATLPQTQKDNGRENFPTWSVAPPPLWQVQLSLSF